MSQVSLRLPDSLHAAVKALAARDNISANQFIAMAVAEKVAALGTVQILRERAAGAPTRERFLELLGKASDTEPDEADRL